MAFGSAIDPSSAEGMRLAALSMVWQNSRDLGCVYPAKVAAIVGVQMKEASGMAAEGERRAESATVP